MYYLKWGRASRVLARLYRCTANALFSNYGVWRLYGRGGEGARGVMGLDLINALNLNKRHEKGRGLRKIVIYIKQKTNDIMKKKIIDINNLLITRVWVVRAGGTRRLGETRPESIII